jgi:hypothetical protein
MSFRATIHGEGTAWGTLTALSPAIRARFSFARYFLVHAEIPFASAIAELPPSVSVDPVAAFRLANPNASFSGLFSIGRRAWISVGLGFAAPVATMPAGDSDGNFTQNDLAVVSAYGLASAMRGSTEPWAYMVDTASVYVPAEVEWGTERARFGWETTLMHGFRVRSLVDLDAVTAIVLGTRVQLHASEYVSFGARLKALFDLTPDVSDRCQVSLEPFGEVAIQRFWFGLGFLMNLDTPNGTGAEVFVWGARVSAGTQF